MEHVNNSAHIWHGAFKTVTLYMYLSVNEIHNPNANHVSAQVWKGSGWGRGVIYGDALA